MEDVINPVKMLPHFNTTWPQFVWTSSGLGCWLFPLLIHSGTTVYHLYYVFLQKLASVISWISWTPPTSRCCSIHYPTVENELLQCFNNIGYKGQDFIKCLYDMLFEFRLMHGIEMWSLEEEWKDTNKSHGRFCTKILQIYLQQRGWLD
jgi:hypothetical protein